MFRFRVATALVFFCSIGCGGRYEAAVPDAPPHLYSYPPSAIEHLFRKKGFEGEIFWMRANPSGTALWAHRLEDGYVGTLFISKPGSSKLQEVHRSGDEIWHNDEGEVIAWRDKAKGIVHLKGGHELAVSKGAGFIADQFAKYFVLSTARDDIKLFSSSDLKTPLSTLEKWPSEIWSRGDKIYVCQNNSPDGELCRVYSVGDRGVVYAGELTIPGWIIQLDPWSDWAITQKPHDFFPPSHYLVNLKTGYSAKLQKLGGRIPMFLVGDVLK